MFCWELTPWGVFIYLISRTDQLLNFSNLSKNDECKPQGFNASLPSLIKKFTAIFNYVVLLLTDSFCAQSHSTFHLVDTLLFWSSFNLHPYSCPSISLQEVFKGFISLLLLHWFHCDLIYFNLLSFFCFLGIWRFGIWCFDNRRLSQFKCKISCRIADSDTEGWKFPNSIRNSNYQSSNSCYLYC